MFRPDIQSPDKRLKFIARIWGARFFYPHSGQDLKPWAVGQKLACACGGYLHPSRSICPWDRGRQGALVLCFAFFVPDEANNQFFFH